MSRKLSPESTVKNRDRALSWHRINREKHLAYMAQRRINCADKIRCGKLKSAFGITLAEYEERLAGQNGLCAICQRPQGIDKRRFAVDHCHSTGRIRGLLCIRCNSALGNFKDSKTLLTLALNYLEKHEQ